MTTAGSTSTSFPTGVELATTVLRSKDAPTPQEAVYASWYAEAESVLRGLSAEKQTELDGLIWRWAGEATAE